MSSSESADLVAAAIERFSTVEVNRSLGFQLRASSPGAAELTMPAEPRFTQETGVIQGGILTSLADTAAVYAILPFLGRDETMTGLELKINFMGTARPGQADLTARSNVLHRGRRTAVCEVTITQEERLVARAMFTFLILSTRSSQSR